MNNDRKSLSEADPHASEQFVLEGLDVPESPKRGSSGEKRSTPQQRFEEQLVFEELTRLNETFEALISGGAPLEGDGGNE